MLTATTSSPATDGVRHAERPSYSQSCCAPSFVKSFFNVSEICCPMSLKKVCYWTAAAGSIAGLALLETQFGVLSAATTFQSVGFMSAIYLFEPVIQTVNLVLAPYPKATVIESEFSIQMKAMMGEMQHLVGEIRESTMAMKEHENPARVDEAGDKKGYYRYYPYKTPKQLVSKEDRSIIPMSKLYVNPVSNSRVEPRSNFSTQSEIVVVSPGLISIPISPDPQECSLSLPHEKMNDVVIADASLELSLLPRNNKNDDVAIVIACHNSADVIFETITSCLRHVNPKQIYVIDNGNSLQPTDNTREIVGGMHPEINYVWSHYGNKTIAQYIGTMLSPYRFVLTIDDDVHLPVNLDFATDKIKGNVKGICFPVRAIHPRKEGSLIVELQDLEYQFSDLAKLVQSTYAGGVCYPHGAVSLWEKEVFMEALRQHDTVFYAEDLKLGLILQKMGYTMVLAAGSWFDTEAPTSYFGETPNLFEQRVRSWEMGRQVYFFKIIEPFFTVWRSTFTENCFLKWAQFYDIYTNFSDWWRLPLLVIMGSDPSFWGRVVEFYAYNIIPALAWNYLKLPLSGRTDLQIPIRACLTLPIYKVTSSALAFGGAIRAVTIYLPNFRAKLTIDEIEKLETADKAKLEKELAAEPQDGPLTFKRIMYRNRFFQPEAPVEIVVESIEKIGRAPVLGSRPN